jgi:hypothetical protein
MRVAASVFAIPASTNCAMLNMAAAIGQSASISRSALHLSAARPRYHARSGGAGLFSSCPAPPARKKCRRQMPGEKGTACPSEAGKWCPPALRKSRIVRGFHNEETAHV